MKINLRGHHLLCLQGFQGYGYDENFIKNMEIINERRKSEGSIIQLSDSADDICRYCPNLENNLCQNEKNDSKIKKMDYEILSKLNKNNEYNGPELFKEVSKIFNTLESVENICSECKWHKECLFYLKLK